MAERLEFLGFPVRMHEPCSDPDCPFCIEDAIVFGRTGGSAPQGHILSPSAKAEEARACAECGRTAWEVDHEGHAIECSEYH